MQRLGELGAADELDARKSLEEAEKGLGMHSETSDKEEISYHSLPF